MEMITRHGVEGLLNNGSEGPHVSIFMPAMRAGQQTQQNPIRFKNLVRTAQARLHERGMKEHEAEVLLRPALRLIDDNEFWQHQNVGLAMFIAQDTCKDYRLPIEFQALTVVQDRFYIKPLLSALTEGECFYVLAVSQNHVRLFACGRDSAREVELNDIPHSLADALGHELTHQDLAFHGATGAGAGERPSHKGQVASGPDDDFKAEIQQFFKRLNRGLKDYLAAGRPLVLAGVEYLLPIYRQATNYEPIVGSITGNFDVERPQTIHEQAWPIVEPYFMQVRDDTLARYRELAGTGRAVNRLAEVVMAAIEGRVDTLFVARDAECWGRFDAEMRQVQVHEKPQIGDEELLDLAVANTFLKDGQVFMLTPEQVPGGQAQAAILRY